MCSTQLKQNSFHSIQKYDYVIKLKASSFEKEKSDKVEKSVHCAFDAKGWLKTNTKIVNMYLKTKCAQPNPTFAGLCLEIWECC